MRFATIILVALCWACSAVKRRKVGKVPSYETHHDDDENDLAQQDEECAAIRKLVIAIAISDCYRCRRS